MNPTRTCRAPFSKTTSWLAISWLAPCALLCLASCGVTHGTAEDQSIRPVSRVRVALASVEIGDVTQELELLGNLVARRRTIVVTEVDGVIRSLAEGSRTFEVEDAGGRRVETLELDLGQRVREGDVLVRIDARDYELAVAAARTALDAAKTDLAVLRAWRRPEEVRRLRALRDQAASHVELAALELERTEGLRADKVVSESEFDRAKSGHTVARAVLDGAEAALLIATSGPTVAEIAMAEARIAVAQAQVDVRADTLARTTIRAPFDGVITERFVDVGERVTAMPRVEILEIMDLSLVFVEVGVPERHMHQVGVGNEVLVYAEGRTEPFQGTVVLVNDKIDRDSRTYRVRVGVDNAERRLKAGQFVRVAFAMRSLEDRLVVPTQAVTYGGGQPQVFVFADERVSLRKVRLGLSDGTRIEILDGLAAGQRVVVDDPAVLSDGMLVDVRTERASATGESAP